MEVERVERYRAHLVRQEEVTQDDDRSLVFVREIECSIARLEALLNSARSEHDAWELAMRGVEDELQVG